MGSILLTSTYHTIGRVIRPLRWLRHVGHLKPDTLDKSLRSPENPIPLEGFSPVRQLGIYAAKVPDRVFIVDNEGEHTFGQVYTNVLRLARALQEECNLKPGERGAIMTFSEREMFEAYLAIRACGGVAVPINFVNKRLTIGFMFSDCEAKILFVGRDPRLIAGAKRLANFGFVKNVISVVPDVDPRFYSYSDLVSKDRPVLDDTRYIFSPPAKAAEVILYTSGTGSAPRGIVYPAENIADATQRVAKKFSITSRDVMLFPIPFYHLAGLISFLGAIYPWGPDDMPCKLVLSEIPRYKEPETIDKTIEAIIKHNVTVFPGAPTIIEAVLEEALNKYRQTNNEQLLLKDLRLILSGGSVMTKKLMRLVRELNQERCKFNYSSIELDTFYAATEIGPISNGVIITDDENNYPRRRTLGHPFEGVSVRTNGRALFEAKTTLGVDHYLNRPELPFLTPDGFVFINDKIQIVGSNGATELIYHGRERGARNIRGNEVSPENTQEELEKVSGINEACIFGVEDKTNDGDVLCAVVIREKGSKLDALEIDKKLETMSLPSRQRPSIYFFEERVPQEIINGSAKISALLAEELYSKRVNRILRNHPNLVNIGPPIGVENYLTSLK